MSDYVPLPQQQAIHAHFNNPKSGSLIVEACAGAGKTTTILESILASRDQTTLICAFNTRIKEDMEEKLATRDWPKNRWIEVRTLHSLGLKLTGSYWHGVQRDKKATDELVRKHFSGHPRARFHVVRLVTHCKDVRPHLHEQDDAVAQATQIVMQEVNDLKILDQPALVHQMAQAVVDVMVASLRQRETIDFADMIWVPVALDLAPKGRYQRVVVDEAQDMSLSQFELIERFVAPGGGLVVVGDLHQGIYEFRGADGAEIWKRMRERWHARTLPLTVSFRCAQAVVTTAKDLVPEIEPKKGAPLGLVDEIEGEELLDHVKPGDFVLSRANAPLVTMAIDCWMRGGLTPVIEGAKEIAEPVLHILEKLSISSIESYRASLERWYNEQVARSTTDANASWTDRVDDWYALLKAVGERVGPSKVRAVLESVFSIKRERPSNGDFSLSVEGPQYISFSTVHKAKGLEADRVFLLKQSFERYQDRDREPPQEELNIEYVAITRAKRHLTWVNINWDGPRSKGASLSGKRVAAPKMTRMTIMGTGGQPTIDVEGRTDDVIGVIMPAVDEIAIKHHGEVPDDDHRFMPEAPLGDGLTVTVHDVQRFQSLTKPHTTVNGVCRHCGVSSSKYVAMASCSGPKPRVFPPAVPKTKPRPGVVFTVGPDKPAPPPKRIFPPAIARKR